VFLHIQAVLQAQGQELFFAQVAGDEALHLIAKLRHALEHQRPVVCIVLVHITASSGLAVLCGSASTGGLCTCGAAR
jgi:hypothetical protein